MNSDVLLRSERGIGWITLNRPDALNALTREMVIRIDAALSGWATDPRVGAVLLSGAGDRGLCAGGDIRSIYQDCQSGGRGSVLFWRDEYRAVARIANYPKPFVSVMDGIVMGGGVGVSAHAGIRIVTERTAIAMPEVGIGLVPDVGGTYLLPRAPGELGTHLALTGSRLDAGDAIACGLADRYLPSDRVEALLDAPSAAELLATIDDLATGAAPPGSGPSGGIAQQRSWIDACYGHDRPEEILAALDSHPEPAARAAAAAIRAKSPSCVAVALRALRSGRRFARVEQALEQEFRICVAALSTPDLAEGIRAQVIDKDRSPRWSPAELSGVTEAIVAGYFAAVPDAALNLEDLHAAT